MLCLPLSGDNPQALVSGSSNVQVDKDGTTTYATYISVDIAHHEISRAKCGKGGIKLSQDERKSMFQYSQDFEEGCNPLVARKSGT